MPAKEIDSDDIEAYTNVLAKSAAELITVLKTTEGDTRRKVVAGISKAAMAAGIDAEAAGALAHLLNTHGQ